MLYEDFEILSVSAVSTDNKAPAERQRWFFIKK